MKPVDQDALYRAFFADALARAVYDYSRGSYGRGSEQLYLAMAYKRRLVNYDVVDRAADLVIAVVSAWISLDEQRTGSEP